MADKSHIIVLVDVENILQNLSFLHEKDTQEIRYNGNNNFLQVMISSPMKIPSKNSTKILSGPINTQ